jgi:hypothetical protein
MINVELVFHRPGNGSPPCSFPFGGSCMAEGRHGSHSVEPLGLCRREQKSFPVRRPSFSTFTWFDWMCVHVATCVVAPKRFKILNMILFSPLCHISSQSRPASLTQPGSSRTPRRRVAPKEDVASWYRRPMKMRKPHHRGGMPLLWIGTGLAYVSEKGVGNKFAALDNHEGRSLPNSVGAVVALRAPERGWDLGSESIEIDCRSLRLFERTSRFRGGGSCLCATDRSPSARPQIPAKLEEDGDPLADPAHSCQSVLMH